MVFKGAKLLNVVVVLNIAVGEHCFNNKSPFNTQKNIGMRIQQIVMFTQQYNADWKRPLKRDDLILMLNVRLKEIF